jgi:transcriptional regulator
MHPNPEFRQTAEELSRAYARERGFGVLTLNGDELPMIAHIPFLLGADGETVDLHLVRSNPIARFLSKTVDPVPAVIAVSGPDGYISPDWYGVDDQVPTWNYVAVHLIGNVRALDQSELHPMLNRLAAHFEEGLTPKKPWTTDKMSDGVLERMMRQIQPFRFDLTKIDSTWKLNQNKSPAARKRAADFVESHKVGSETGILSALMRGTL